MVLAFNNPIHSRVVSGNANMMDTILCRQPNQCSDVRCSIVRDDLLNRTPMTQDILEDETTNGDACFCVKCAPFQPSSE